TRSPTSSSDHWHRSHSPDSDKDCMKLLSTEESLQVRKETTRRQRIEVEQRRRDDLRDVYSKLKDQLPASKQRSSKVSLLVRATSHIVDLNSEHKMLKERVASLENKIQRLQTMNEKLSSGS
ncbi:hypothetical protein B0H13DRAFT_1512661, partial [Mycena leptocephala]